MTQAMLADETVLVIGTGYVGRRFMAQRAPELSVGLSRSAITPPQHAEIFDLDSNDALPVSLPNRYAVVYTVAPSRESLSDVRLQRLLPKLAPAARRFVYISTTGVYGNRDGSLVDEDTPVKTETDRAKRRVAAEELLQSWGEKSGSDIVILRVPGIYGPGRLGIERIQQGLPVIAENDAGPGNRIHVADLVRCCEAALNSDIPAGIYNVGDGDTRTSTWFSNEVARQSRLQPPPIITMAAAKREFSPLRMSFLKESRRVDTRKMRDVLGVTPRYANAGDGIRASLAEE